jgi:hypothetical protein
MLSQPDLILMIRKKENHLWFVREVGEMAENFPFDDRKQAIKDCLTLLTQKHRYPAYLCGVAPKGSLVERT